MVTKHGDLAIPTAVDDKVGIPEGDEVMTASYMPEASPEARLKAKAVKLMLTVTIQRPLAEGEMEQLRQNGGDLTGLLYDGLEVKIEKVTGRHAG